MIKIHFGEPDSQEWNNWKLACHKSTLDLVARAAAKESIDIDVRIYREVKPVLFQLFNYKCAYCESELISNQFGDIEHYRPKKGLADENNRRIKHTGYYWLAYDWRNLLPSCRRCNSVEHNIGKGLRFPVKGFRAKRPGEEENEKPMLLHPIFDDPEDHFLFEPENGILAAKTEEAQITIDILGLNRESLLQHRRNTHLFVSNAIIRIVSAALDNNTDMMQKNLQITQEHIQGKAAYSLAGRRALADAKEKLGPVIQLFAQL